jgi:copper chaperone CopZ
MKTFNFFSIGAIALMVSGIFTSCSNSGAKKHDEFYVRGNCEMCKERIESTVKGLPGVANAEWDVDSKALSVDYDSTKITSMQIHSACAKVGHGTKMVAMDDKAHAELPDCCQMMKEGETMDQMMMETDTVASSEEHMHDHHDHEGHSH